MFNVGDKVIAKFEDSGFVKEGEVYTIHQVRDSGLIELQEMRGVLFGQRDFELSKNNEYRLLNVVFVTHDDDTSYVKRNFLFCVPKNIEIKIGEKLFADTKYGEKLVTARTNSFKIGKDGLEALAIVEGCHADNMKSIVGRAKHRPEWEKVQFECPFDV